MPLIVILFYYPRVIYFVQLYPHHNNVPPHPPFKVSMILYANNKSSFHVQALRTYKNFIKLPKILMQQPSQAPIQAPIEETFYSPASTILSTPSEEPYESPKKHKLKFKLDA